MCIYIYMAVFRLSPYPRTVTRHRPFGNSRDLGHGKACYDMPRHGMPWHGMPWHDMPCHGMPCRSVHGMPWHGGGCFGGDSKTICHKYTPLVSTHLQLCLAPNPCTHHHHDFYTMYFEHFFSMCFSEPRNHFFSILAGLTL